MNHSEEEGDEDPENSYLKKEAEKKELKIKRFEISSKQNIVWTVVAVTLVSFVFILIGTVDFFLSLTNMGEIDWLLDCIQSLIFVQIFVNLTFAAFYEEMCQKKADFSIDGKLIMDNFLQSVNKYKK